MNPHLHLRPDQPVDEINEEFTNVDIKHLVSILNSRIGSSTSIESNDALLNQVLYSIGFLSVSNGLVVIGDNVSPSGNINEEISASGFSAADYKYFNHLVSVLQLSHHQHHWMQNIAHTSAIEDFWGPFHGVKNLAILEEPKVENIIHPVR